MKSQVGEEKSGTKYRAERENENSHGATRTPGRGVIAEVQC